MEYIEPYRDDRASLLALVAALDASPRALRRDECGDWSIFGNAGRVYVDGGDAYLITITTGESARRWTFIKERLSLPVNAGWPRRRLPSPRPPASAA
jgi:hypothetical protein